VSNTPGSRKGAQSRGTKGVLFKNKDSAKHRSFDAFRFFGNTVSSARVDLRRATGEDLNESIDGGAGGGCAGVVGGGLSKARGRDTTFCRLEFEKACEFCVHSKLPLKHLNIVAELVVTVTTAQGTVDVSQDSICWTIMPLISPSLAAPIQDKAPPKLAYFPLFAGSPRLLLMLGTDTQTLYSLAQLQAVVAIKVLQLPEVREVPETERIDKAVIRVLRENELQPVCVVKQLIAALPVANQNARLTATGATCPLRLEGIRLRFNGSCTEFKNLKSAYFTLARQVALKGKIRLGTQSDVNRNKSALYQRIFIHIKDAYYKETHCSPTRV